MVFFKQERKLILPEPEDATFLFFFIPVNFLVKARGKSVQVVGGITAGVEGSRIGEIIREFHKPVGKYVGVIKPMKLLFVLLPFVSILLQELGFSHGW